jgi:hypothetical protein
MDIEFLNGSVLGALDKVGAVAVVLFVALMVITDKLVWHKRLKAAEARADKWELIALDALMTGARAGRCRADDLRPALRDVPVVADLLRAGAVLQGHRPRNADRHRAVRPFPS